MSAHTPGPWWPVLNPVRGWEIRTHRDIDIGGRAEAYLVGTDYGAILASEIGDHTESRTRGNEEANARLIASAPELLAIAQDYAASCAECDGTGVPEFGEDAGKPCPDCADVRAVIAKATEAPIQSKPMTPEQEAQEANLRG